MKIQLSAEEIKAIVTDYCKKNLDYPPTDGTIKLVTEKDQLFAEFEVTINVESPRKA